MKKIGVTAGLYKFLISISKVYHRRYEKSRSTWNVLIIHTPHTYINYNGNKIMKKVFGINSFLIMPAISLIRVPISTEFTKRKFSYLKAISTFVLKLFKMNECSLNHKPVLDQRRFSFFPLVWRWVSPAFTLEFSSRFSEQVIST